MAMNVERAVFMVGRHELGWAVKHDGEVFDAALTREEVMASACRRARASNERGAPARVLMEGDPVFRLR